MGAFPNLSRFVPVCPLLSRFVPVLGPKKDRKGQTGTKRDRLGQIAIFGKRPHLESTPIKLSQISKSLLFAIVVLPLCDLGISAQQILEIPHSVEKGGDSDYFLLPRGTGAHPLRTWILFSFLCTEFCCPCRIF